MLTPDEESVAAFGINPLDPGVRGPAAQAGYAQGQRAAAGVARLWQLPGRSKSSEMSTCRATDQDGGERAGQQERAEREM